MSEKVAQIVALLKEAAEAHHIVYRKVDGDDPDWASWYAQWLIELSELPDILGRAPVRSELIYHLVRLDKVVAAGAAQGDWREYYAEQLIQELGS